MSNRTDELERLQQRVAELELQHIAVQRAFETAGEGATSQLASLFEAYVALFTAFEGLQKIATALEAGEHSRAARLVDGLLLRLSEYDERVHRLPFAEVPAGASFRHAGATFRKYAAYRAGPAPLANALNLDDDSEAWFEDDVLVVVAAGDFPYRP